MTRQSKSLYQHLTLNQIFDWQADGKEICGYVRNAKYHGTRIRGTCALNQQACVRRRVPQIMEDCEYYHNAKKRGVLL